MIQGCKSVQRDCKDEMLFEQRRIVSFLLGELLEIGIDFAMRFVLCNDIEIFLL